MHFHNTRNTGFANATVAVDSGVFRLDSSIGGIGGCPFAPRATGNVATEDLMWMLDRMGYDTGLDLSSLKKLSSWLATQLGRDVPSMQAKVETFPP